MTKAKNKTNSKTKKKKKKSYIYNYFIIFGIFLYMFFNGFMNLYNITIKTDNVKYGEISSSMIKEGVIIRDENVISAKSSGKITYFVKEGERVPIGKKIAEIETKELDLNLKEKLDITNRKIQSLVDNKSSSLLKEDIDKLDNNIYMLKREIKNKLIDNDFENIEELKEDLLYNIDKRSLIIGDKGISNKSLQTLQEEKKVLENKIKGCIETVTSERAGVVSFKTDGIEDVLKPDLLNNLNSTYLLDIKKERNIINKQEVNVSEPIAKIVNNHNWYIAFVIDDKDIKNFDVGKKLKIEKDSKSFYGKITYVYKDETKKNIVVVEVDEENNEIIDYRVDEFKITYKQSNGIKISKEAIVNLDNKRGVYVVSETGNAKFKELKSIYDENDKYVVLNYNDIQKNNIKTVQLYDEVIINPKKIKDGQKVR